MGFIKDLWRLRASIGSKMVGDNGEELESNEEKALYLATHTFKWAEEEIRTDDYLEGRFSRRSSRRPLRAISMVSGVYSISRSYKKNQ